MELIQLPEPMRNRGFTGWPQVYMVGRNEEAPPAGIAYIRAQKVDFALLFRLMVPTLQRQHGYFDWPKIYRELTGKKYVPQRVYYQDPKEGCDNGSGASYSESEQGPELVTLEDLASDEATYVDLDVLAQLAMIPTFMVDIREAIRVNVTNSYMWTDGYNKKTGLCSGYLTEQPKARSLIILDISSSIPDGVSAGMMTLVKTMTEITNADLIITGGISRFYEMDQVRSIDIHKERREIPRGNESRMFRKILKERDMDYENVITFGDSDNPGENIFLGQTINTKRWYSFFTMPYDTYGSHYTTGAGYGRWVLEANPNVQVIHNTEWAKFFTNAPREKRW